jgi:hypothetical protein
MSPVPPHDAVTAVSRLLGSPMRSRGLLRDAFTREKQTTSRLNSR